MKITMKEAILQGKDFQYNNCEFTMNEDGEYTETEEVRAGSSFFRTTKPKFILENQDKLVEVECVDKCSHKTAYIWECKKCGKFHYSHNGQVSKEVQEILESAQAELDKLKAEQKARM